MVRAGAGTTGAAAGTATARAIPGSRFVVVRGGSHFAHYETPGPVTRQLSAS